MPADRETTCRIKITKVTAYLAKDWRTYLYVVVDTDEGIYGVGEAGIIGRELAVAGRRRGIQLQAGIPPTPRRRVDISPAWVLRSTARRWDNIRLR